MPLKFSYKKQGQKHAFDRNSLDPGDHAFQVIGFREGSDATKPINITLELVWSSQEANEEHIGRSFEHGVFLDGPNSGQTFRQLKDFAKASGFNHSEWTEDSGMDLGTMLVGLLKLLAVDGLWIMCKVVAGKTDPTTRFLNLIKILRDNPGTGESLPNQLPEAPVPPQVILDAMDAEAPGEKKAAGGGGDVPF